MATKGFDAGVLSADQMVATAKGMQWLVAGVFLLISFIGTYVQFVGGWDIARTFDSRGVQALIYSFGFQFVCSAGQFAFLKVRAWFWYGGCLVVSVVPSILSYWELTGPWFSDKLTGPGAFIIIVIACVALDSVPERILVKR